MHSLDLPILKEPVLLKKTSKKSPTQQLGLTYLLKVDRKSANMPWSYTLS